MNQLERDFIYLYDSIKNGYNLKEGGNNGKLSEESLKKISEKSKLYHHTPETKKKMSESRLGELNPFFGKKHTDETKELLSKLTKNKIVSEETKRKMSLYQQNMPEEHKLNISKSLKGKKKTPLSKETKDKLSKIMYGKIVSNETRIKMSKSLKGKSKSDKHKLNLSKKITQYDLDMNKIKEWKSLSDASKNLSISCSCISQCCHNKRNSAGGFIWSFV